MNGARPATPRSEGTWNAGPVPNVAKTRLVGGQWRVNGGTAELVIVSNAQALDIPRTGEIQPMA